MSSIFGIMDIGKQGLFASQRALQVTGQNIANVNTRGYTRQEAIFESLTSLRGVRLQDVRRVRDQFIDVRKQNALNNLGASQVRLRSIGRIEAILDETSQDGIGVAFSQFFQALQDLTLAPGNTSEREVVRSQAKNLIHALQSAYAQLELEQKAADTQVGSAVTEVNQILQSIAEINAQLITSAGNETQNELLDRRQQLIFELQRKVPVNVINVGETAASPNIAIYSQSGMPLVLGTDASALIARKDRFNQGFFEVVIRDESGVEQVLSPFLKGGELGGAIGVRDQLVPQQLRWLDELAARFATVFNLQHEAGTTLLNTSGVSFFEPVSVFADVLAGNTLNAGISGDLVVDQSLLTFDDYEIVFTAPGVYDVLNVTQGTTVVSGAAYVSGAAIVFDGIQVTIADSSGAPQTGDRFQINTVNRAAAQLGLSSAILSAVENIAAGNTANPGDNENALALAALENAALFQSATIGTFIGTQQSNLGITARQYNNEFETDDFTDQQMNNFIEEVSGVSLDEESSNLIRFQRSYQAAAKVITVMDELAVTLIGLVR